MLWVSASLVGLLLLFASVLSGLETAIVASSPGRIQKKRSDGDNRAKILLNLIKNKEKVISTLLIANSIVNTVATTIAAGVIEDLVGDDHGVIVAAALMSVLIIVFAEVIPKAIAVSKAESIALAAAPVVNFALVLMKPINFALEHIVKAFCWTFKINLKTEISAAEEVRGVIEHYHQEGNVIKTDRDMLGGVLDLRKMTVDQVMIHRSQVVMINADLAIAEITTQALNTIHTRIPLWQGTKDNIIGILHIRSLLKALHKYNYDYNKLKLKEFITEPWFVPAHALLSRQLHEFRERRSHIALVVDEYGDILGILTLEDILEEIVGQIDDEHDRDNSQILNKAENKYLVEGSTPIRDVNRELNIELPYEDAHTIAGLIMHVLERLPEIGETITVANVKIAITKKQGHRIKKALIEILPAQRENNSD